MMAAPRPLYSDDDIEAANTYLSREGESGMFADMRMFRLLSVTGFDAACAEGATAVFEPAMSTLDCSYDRLLITFADGTTYGIPTEPLTLEEKVIRSVALWINATYRPPEAAVGASELLEYKNRLLKLVDDAAELTIWMKP